MALPIDYTPPFLLIDNFFHRRRGAEDPVEKRDSQKNGGEKIAVAYGIPTRLVGSMFGSLRVHSSLSRLNV